MIKKLARQLSLVFAVACLAISANQSLAQSATSTPPSSPSPTVVTGTDPPPQTVLALVVLSVILLS
jgi:hypothetical protein